MGKQRIKISMKVNSALFKIIFISSIAAVSAFAQFPLSVGVKGGIGLTDAFSNTTVPQLNGSTNFFSGSKDYVVGPMIELRLPLHFAIEADALYRPLNLTTATTSTVSPGFKTSETYNEWEFPLLLKYRFHSGPIQPYVEAGPSWRTVSFPSAFNQLSTAGFTAGGGVEFHALHVRIAPEVRYTRWGSDTGAQTSSFVSPASNLNQAELLVGISF